MTRYNKMGIILIAIGVLLPITLLSIVSGYRNGAGFIDNLFGLKVVFAGPGNSSITIPYRFILAAGVTLVFLGIRSIDMARTDSKNDRDSD